MTSPKSNRRYHIRLEPDVEERVLARIHDPDYTYGFPKGSLSALVNRALRLLLRTPRK